MKTILLPGTMQINNNTSDTYQTRRNFAGNVSSNQHLMSGKLHRAKWHHGSLVLLLTTILLLSASVAQATTITSAQTGNWSAGATWTAVTRTGTISYSTNSTAVTGTGTSFTTELSVGSIILTTGTGAITRTIAFITDNTHLTLTANAGQTQSGKTFTAQVVPLPGDAVIIAHAVTMDVNVTQTSAGSITINSGGTLNVTNSAADPTIGALTINSSGIANLSRSVTVLGATNISGTVNFGSTSGGSRAMNFTGAVTLNSGAVWTEPSSGNGANDTYSFANNFTNNATTFTAVGTGTHTFSGTGMTISGSTATAIPNITISGTYTNNGTITASTSLAGGGTLTNGATGILNIGATAANLTLTTLTATATGNTVNYNGATQTVKVAAYDNLILSGNGAKTLAAGVIVNSLLSMQATATTLGASPTFISLAILEYKGSAVQTTNFEFPPTFSGAGVIINNSNGVALGASRVVTGLINITSGTLNMAGKDLSVGSITGSGNITNNIAGTSTLTIGTSNTPSTYPGLISNGSTPGTMIVALTKTGTDVLTLTNSANSYTGATTITAGELRLIPASTTATFTSPVVLNGGKVSTSGITTGTTMTSSAALNLNFVGNSFIDLGSNPHTLKFAA
ncbi:MAG: autotransporter-associated beta strand repeat-containing protein, partial [Bacteroidales bacterium]